MQSSECKCLSILRIRRPPGSTAALIPVKRQENFRETEPVLHHMVCVCVRVCLSVCICDIRKPRLFTDSLTQMRISLHFLAWMGVLCAQPPQPQFSPLLGDFSILAYTLHSTLWLTSTLFCVCECVWETHVLEMWLISLHWFRQTGVGVVQRCTNLSLKFHFHCSNFDLLSTAVFHFHSFLPPLVLLSLSYLTDSIC